MSKRVYTAPQLLIAGRWRDGRHASAHEVVDPATAQVIAHLGLASAQDMELALAAAETGFARWREVPAQERCARLERGVARMRERQEAIACLLTMEQGKPLAEARAESAMAADLIQWYAQEARRIHGRVIAARQPDSRMSVLKQPVGPVAAFAPWNFPLVLSARKIGGALAAGCSIVLKGAEETPASVAAMVACFEPELPEGALQLLFGVPAEVSAQLIASDVIRKVSFTGSVPVGRQLAQLAAVHLKRITLELGGHAPVIICRDADLERAARLMAMHKFRNAGQACLAPTRFYVERPVYGDFLDAFASEARKLVLGPGLDATTQMGPLANGRRRDAVRQLVAQSVAAGAQAMVGEAPEGGFFAPVSILTNVQEHSPVLEQEPFGPVAVVVPVDGLEQAIALANRSRYGLAGYLFTDSARAVHRVSERLEVGSLAINNMAVSVPEAPFGGVKDSGYGSESGIEGIDAFLDTKFTHYCA